MKYIEDHASVQMIKDAENEVKLIKLICVLLCKFR